MEKRCILSIPEHRLTPGMRQYREAKLAHPDCLILLRMGDFYEIFYEDAVVASKALDITLTSRGKGDRAAPLAGVPYHALDTYLHKLIKAGHRVAIVEQLEDPKLAKGLVKRGVVRVVTPGTLIESTMLDEQANNYLVALTAQDQQWMLAYTDISTGEFASTVLVDRQALHNELMRLQPGECILAHSLQVDTQLLAYLRAMTVVTAVPDAHFGVAFARDILEKKFGSMDLPTVRVCGALLAYVQQTQKTTFTHMQRPQLQSNQDTMVLDGATCLNLEITQNSRDRLRKGTLLAVLDSTVTALGARCLKRWLRAPLTCAQQIQMRLDAVEKLTQGLILREDIVAELRGVGDLERLLTRVSFGTASPRDLVALGKSLARLPTLGAMRPEHGSNLLQDVLTFPDVHDLADEIQQAVREQPPASLREGGVFIPSYDDRLARLVALSSNSKKLLMQLEQREQQRSGIGSLKVKYNRVFGYYIEINRRYSATVPENYERKQTMANAERFITPELKVLEQQILEAKDKMIALEQELYAQLLAKICQKQQSIQACAQLIAVLDVLCCFASVAAKNKYVKPILHNDDQIALTLARHPVIEQTVPHFVANDVSLHTGELLLITGPNMAGKSTILRQVALIVLMAQVGCFVPATAARLGVVDRIFTRVGAHDHLAGGQSTFMVEMQETADILAGATQKSLIIMDELGRGTSTFDGVSLAWSIAEHIHNTVKAKTLFATHYHVMNTLAKSLPRVSNYNVAVRQDGQHIVFLRKLVPGGVDQSFGIHVAAMAGIPAPVVARARQVQALLEADDAMQRKLKAQRLDDQVCLDTFRKI